jgi:hypothetical protein
MPIVRKDLICVAECMGLDSVKDYSLNNFRSQKLFRIRSELVTGRKG